VSEPLDPTREAALALNRRVFVELGAGVAAGGPIAASAPAALGKPHDPFVPEEDPAIVVFRPQLQSSGRIIDTYAAIPKDAPPGTPGVVLTMPIWGVDAQIRDVIRRLAKIGYVAVAPDLYSGMGAPSGDGQTDVSYFIPYFKKLVDITVDSDLAASAGWIRSRLPEEATSRAKVAIMGFCGGGTIALRQTVVDFNAFQAAAIFYGSVEGLDPKSVHVPIVGSYGARDTSNPVDQVRAFYANVADPTDLKIYDLAGHAFFDDTRASYVASTAEDAWKRTRRWLAWYLKGLNLLI